MKINWEKETVLIHSNLVVSLEAARREVEAAFPHLIAKYTVKKVWEGNYLRYYIDWKELFKNAHIQAHLINKKWPKK